MAPLLTVDAVPVEVDDSVVGGGVGGCCPVQTFLADQPSLLHSSI